MSPEEEQLGGEGRCELGFGQVNLRLRLAYVEGQGIECCGPEGWHDEKPVSEQGLKV